MKAKEVRIVKEVKKEWWLVTFCLWRSFFVENQIEAEQILETLKKSLSIPSCTKRRIPGEYPIRFAQSFPSNPFSIKIRLKWSENSDIRWSVVPFRILCLTRRHTDEIWKPTTKCNSSSCWKYTFVLKRRMSPNLIHLELYLIVDFFVEILFLGFFIQPMFLVAFCFTGPNEKPISF